MNVVVTSGLAGLGHNNPPEEKQPTPFELSKKEIEDLFLEAKNWADGTPIENQKQADAVAKLRDQIRDAEALADERRKLENKPFDDGKAEVQARYAELIADTKGKQGKTVLARAALSKTLQPWLIKLENEKNEAIRVAREAAEAAEALARKALEDVRVNFDLGAREHAEVLITEAKQADMIVSRVEKAKVQVKGTGRAVGLRTTYRPEITDMQAFARFVWTTHFDDLSDALTSIAGKLVDRGIRTMDGCTVHEERSL